jgi:GNAT superfamily N-acetyltransferase
MFEGFRGFTIREADTLKLRWQVYIFLYLKNSLFLSTSVLVGIILAIFLFFQSQLVDPDIVTIIFFFESGILSFLITSLALSFQVFFSSANSPYQRIWMLEQRGKLIAIASFQFQQQYSNLMRLEVSRSFRGQGFGSYFIQQLFPNVPKPIYVVPRPKTISFYQQNGFSICSAEQCPETLRYSFWKVLVRR